MKKFLAKTVAVMTALALLPTVAQASAEDALAEVKNKVFVDGELTEFNYTENKYDNSVCYEFLWSNEDDSKNLYVTCDSEGEIVSYEYYERSDYSQNRKLIDYNKADAEEKAYEIVRGFFGEYFKEGAEDRLILNDDCTTMRYSGRHKTFSFKFDRYFGEDKVESNCVEVRIRATKDKIYIQSVNASLDENAVFKKNEAIFNGDEKEERYEEKFPINLYYKTDYSQSGNPVRLFYSIDKGYVAYSTGEIITEEYFDRYENFVAGVESADESGRGENAKADFTQKEQEELENMKNLVDARNVEKRLRDLKLLGITDDMKLNNTYTYKRDNHYLGRFTLEGEKREIGVVFNAETGEVTNIYSYFKEDEEEKENVKPLGEEEAKEFMRSLAGDKVEETEISENYNVTSAIRKIDGVKFPENRIQLAYDVQNGIVTRYNISWHEDVSGFEKAEEVIGEEASRKILFENAKTHDVWLRQNDGYEKAVTIEETTAIYALTGECVSYSNNEKKEYTDLENHWAEEAVNALWEHDIYLKGEGFEADEAVTRADMIRLFVACKESGTSLIYSDDESVLSYAVEMGYLDEGENRENVTRKEAFEVLARVLGYGEIAGFDIYKTSYNDMSACGSAEILKAMGILSGDTARGEDFLTRGEAAVMVYRYLKR